MLLAFRYSGYRIYGLIIRYTYLLMVDFLKVDTQRDYPRDYLGYLQGSNKLRVPILYAPKINYLHLLIYC